MCSCKCHMNLREQLSGLYSFPFPTFVLGVKLLQPSLAARAFPAESSSYWPCRLILINAFAIFSWPFSEMPIAYECMISTHGSLTEPWSLLSFSRKSTFGSFLISYYQGLQFSFEVKPHFMYLPTPFSCWHGDEVFLWELVCVIQLLSFLYSIFEIILSQAQERWPNS